MDEAATAAIVEGWAGPGAPAALVRALHDRTGGNPFCVEETLRELEESGVLGRGAWPAGDALGLPAGVREAVTRRLDRLEPDERWLLRLAAVMGSAVTADDLEACARAARAAGAAPVEPAMALDALERATAARLTREAADDGAFDFAHALVRETLVGELSAARRARLHVAVAEAIDGTGGDAGPLAAYHLAAAGAEADPEVAADTACSAAEQAMARAAYAQAAEHLERTLVIPGLDGARRGDLLVRLGQARARAGAGDAARAAFDQAAALARAGGDGVLLARAAIGAGGLGVVVTGEDPARSALLREAIATLGDGDPALRARLVARLATERHYAAGGDRLTLSAEAVGLARASGDPDALLEALVPGASASGTPTTWPSGGDRPRAHRPRPRAGRPGARAPGPPLAGGRPARGGRRPRRRAGARRARGAGRRPLPAGVPLVRAHVARPDRRAAGRPRRRGAARGPRCASWGPRPATPTPPSSRS